MNTVELDFVKMEKLPVPTSLNEMLCCKDPDGDIYCFQALRNKGAGTFMFICDIEEGFTYSHVTVTAKQESRPFIIGDKVIVDFDGIHIGRIVEIGPELIGVKVDMFKTIYAVPERIKHKRS